MQKFIKKIVQTMRTFSESQQYSKDIAKVSRGWSSFMG